MGAFKENWEKVKELEKNVLKQAVIGWAKIKQVPYQKNLIRLTRAVDIRKCQIVV